MGCDIHVFVESRARRDDDDGTWYNRDHFTINYGYEVGREFELGAMYEQVPIYNNRNYDLFALLAGVRSSSNIVPIDEPRGIPDDVCEFIQSEFDKWHDDAHTPSFFTLAELKEASFKHKGTEQSWFISPEDAAALDERGIIPTEYYYASCDEPRVRRSWVDMQNPFDELIKGLERRMSEVFWCTHYSSTERIKYESKIRIVFWFDN